MTAHEIEEYLAPMRHEFADPRSLILPALKFAQGDSGWLPVEDMADLAAWGSKCWRIMDERGR